MIPELLEAVDAAFCINLRRRKDKWAFMWPQFERCGLEVTRFEAINGATLKKVPESPPLVYPLKGGALASLLSHHTVISMAKIMGYKGVLIFEDDAKLNHRFNEMTSQFLRDMPSDWEMFYLGGKIMLDKRLVRGYCCRPSYMYWTVAYAVRDVAYDRCLAALETRAHWADQLLAGLHPQMMVYTPDEPRPVERSTKFDSDNIETPRAHDVPYYDTPDAAWAARE
jgi:GR25 family glycosyltransferase involved in LPS biosynthesis